MSNLQIFKNINFKKPTKKGGGVIKFANGKSISDIVISTALGTSGSGMFPYTCWPGYRSLVKTIKEKEITVFAKSSTRNPLIGNFILRKPRTWKYIQRIPEGGMINAYGLTNDGIEVNAKKIATACGKGFRVIPNIYPLFAKGLGVAIAETLESMAILERYMREYFWAMEINYSCPNSKECIAQNMSMALTCSSAVEKRYPHIIQIAKTSIVHPFEFYPRLQDVGVDVIHVINTIPHDLVFPGKTSPLQNEHVGGGGV
ncbi:MAG: hypothetical protein WA019_00810, partial [Candidatus Moraniibacteriota bacterium]